MTDTMAIPFISDDESIRKAPETPVGWKPHSEAATSGSAELQVHQLLQSLQTVDVNFDLHIELLSHIGIKIISYSQSYFPDTMCEQIRQLLSKDGEKQLGHETCRDARLKVFSSIGVFLGNSKTLYFNTRHLLGLPTDFHYKFNLQTLLWPVQSSPVLEELWLGGDFTTEESWVVLADIIRAVKTLHTLAAYSARILVPELKLLTEAVAATFPSPLRKLDLSDNDIFNAAGAVLLVNVLRAAPNLLELRVCPFNDIVGAEQMGLAVASHRSLETVFLYEY